jgi:hypothetical protein
VETAETVSVAVDQAVELVPGGVLVKGHKETAYPSGVVEAPEGDAVAAPYHAPEPIAFPAPPPEPPADAAAAADPPDRSEPTVPSSQPTISETLEELAREGARRMLERALHAEVDGYLGRRRYDRVEDDFAGYRNGYAREREISIGTWSVEVRPPRVADSPGHIPPFRSSILPRGRNLTYATSACSPGSISRA